MVFLLALVVNSFALCERGVNMVVWGSGAEGRTSWRGG